MTLGFDPDIQKLLRCPQTGAELSLDGDRLVGDSVDVSYSIDSIGVPLFAEKFLSSEARTQQEHYDRIAETYNENLSYPHTQAYMAHLDEALFRVVGEKSLGTMVELCCGSGEAVGLLRGHYDRAIGVDISQQMLNIGRRANPDRRIALLQGDATRLPLADSIADTVVMLGGIHHVNDRENLFAEIKRVLRPGGRFLFREPVDDFFLWRFIRYVIYRLSPMLDHETEQPLRFASTEADITASGLSMTHWSTTGFFGFCLFMNSDVLVFNRLFRFIPGIRGLTRFSAKLDDLLIAMPGMSRNGLIVVGEARKSAD